MPRAVFRRPAHRVVARALALLDGKVLDQCGCFFGGGTRIVLELDEYRESIDIDFLCASQAGYKVLREAIGERSLGVVAKKGLDLAREVRADQYGIRTLLRAGPEAIKFEIVREARIDLQGEWIGSVPVPVLGHVHSIAEKFLANADRGLDRSALSRDLVDLAFMLRHWGEGDARAGYALAEGAYGASVSKALAAAIALWTGNRAYRQGCIRSLSIDRESDLAAGMKELVALDFAKARSRPRRKQ